VKNSSKSPPKRGPGRPRKHPRKVEVEAARAAYMRARADRAETQALLMAAGWVSIAELNPQIARLRSALTRIIRGSHLDRHLADELIDDLAALKPITNGAGGPNGKTKR
jgi:hypothetical protein